MNNNTNYEILAKFFSGECSEEEKKNVKNWIDENPDNREIFDLIEKLWTAHKEETEPSDINKLWNELTQKAGIPIHEDNHQTYEPELDEKNWFIKFWYSGNRILRYAAVTILVSLISYSVYLIIKPGETEHDVNYKFLSVDAGKQSSITLSDGTIITLDSRSELYYPGEFSASVRKVKLKGEAYFEVTPNIEKPFEVEANDALVIVRGTKFNIRSWNENTVVQVKVTEGSVSLSQKKKPLNRVIIEKGFGSELHTDGTITPSHTIDIEQTLLWLKGEMYLDNASVSEVAAQLERWYDIKIIFSDRVSADERITVHIGKRSLEKNLKLLTQLTDSRYEISGKEVFIQPLSK